MDEMNNDQAAPAAVPAMDAPEAEMSVMPEAAPAMEMPVEAAPAEAAAPEAAA
jgi:hypothetical protein